MVTEMTFNLSMTAFQWQIFTALADPGSPLASSLAAAPEKLGCVSSDLWRSAELAAGDFASLVALVEAGCNSRDLQEKAALAAETSRDCVEAELLLCDVLLAHVKSEVEFCTANAYPISEQVIA